MTQSTKKGRPKTNPLSRKEQYRLAQQKRRARLKEQENRKELNLYVYEETYAHLNHAICKSLGITQSQAIDCLVNYAIETFGYEAKQLNTIFSNKRMEQLEKKNESSIEQSKAIKKIIAQRINIDD